MQQSGATVHHKRRSMGETGAAEVSGCAQILQPDLRMGLQPVGRLLAQQLQSLIRSGRQPEQMQCIR
jgi:hypothetical protein